MNGAQPVGVRHNIVVMMNPLSTKNRSTPITPPWKTGRYQLNQCSAMTTAIATARMPSR